MRILFLTQVLSYPLVGGAKIRAYYVLRQLAQRHEVTLVSFRRADDRQEDAAHLEQFCAAVYTVPLARSAWQDARALLASLVSDQPLVIARDRIAVMEALLARLVQSAPFDAVHADQTAMGQYALFAQAAQARHGPPPRILLDQHNALYLLVARQARYERGPHRRWLWRREARRLARYEAELLPRFDHILTVTAEDRQALLRLLPAGQAEQTVHKLSALPICVDPPSRPPLPRHDWEPRIIHLGTMFWPPNVEGVLWFAEEVLPLIVQQVPNACFTIAGKQPPESVQRLALDGAPLAGHIEVTGFLPNAEPLLATSRVFVVPVRAGGGMRVKIIDAWQWGLPLVSTTIGAEGIATRPGENILLADEAQAFADAVVRVLTDADLARRLRANGRAWVEEHYDWRKVYPQLDTIYQTLGHSTLQR